MNRGDILKKFALTITASAVCAWVNGAELPAGGQISAGAGSIVTQDANRLVVNQQTDRLAIDWASFSIGAGRSVQFNQPSASAVALNRVNGVDPSVIQGSLTANGQVFLVNPNGVIFGRDAQVSVGSLIATTRDISQADFMNGNYQFSAGVTGQNTAVINQGRIQTGEGGTVGLIAARVINDGVIRTPSGQTHLVAADDVVVDFGGPVKVQVQRGAIDALVQNGGAVYAPGGLIYFRAQAADAVSRSVINQTGIVEAQTLQTGQAGQIMLLASGADSTVNAGGTLDASAPQGGSGGFIETSAAKVNLDPALRVSTHAAQGATGEWLIDPTNITITSGTGGTFTSGASSDTTIGASTIETQLASTNVTIQTSSSGTEDGNITVDAPISWSANKLTLVAHKNIQVNADLNATGSASLAFEFGAGGNFSFANGVSAWVPSASAFTWKEGTGSTNPLYFNSGALRFGNNQAAINAGGNLLQPFYNSGGTWYKLTYSSYPLNLAIGVDGTETTNPWNLNGTISDISSSTSQRINVAGYRVGNASTADAGKAWGELVSETLISVGGTPVKVTNTYSMEKDSAYMRAVTALGNPSTSTSDLTNLRLWVGTQDDWVGNTDSPTKTKGNFVLVPGTNGNPDTYQFSAITNATDQAKALKVSSGNETVFFYSTSSGANASINSCCSFSNAYQQDPMTSATTLTGDGSYAMFSKFNNLTPGSSNSITWFYAAGAVSDLTAVINQVAGAAQQAETQQAAASSAATTLALSAQALSAVYGQAPTPPTITSNNNLGSFSYASSDTSVVQVNPTTGALTVVGPGTATITITQAAATGFTQGTSSYTFTVQAAQPTLAGLPASARLRFNEVYVPQAITSASPGAISFSSSNANVARVDPITGLVTPVGVGRVTITATQAASGGFAASSTSYTLDVEAPNLPTILQSAQTTVQGAASGTAAAASLGQRNPASTAIQSTGAAIRSAARVVPVAPAAILPPTLQASVDQVASQLPVTSGGLALLRVAADPVVSAASAGPVVAALADTQVSEPVAAVASGTSGTTATTATASAASASAGGGDALGFMRVFVVGGGIQLTANAPAANATSSNPLPASVPPAPANP